ncbi:uncharacterized protein LOC133176402 [Saccostrea echinata]|uniref:uncharacterized protein LOC133176402 n=1 Tax=Saccostrea echinata TaxID=191078 RepID=UPI002A7ECE06|nr:uncharacterized protein LOC133176402 [Saccostrea echinata]
MASSPRKQYVGRPKILTEYFHQTVRTESGSAPYSLQENVSSTPIRKLRDQDLHQPDTSISEISSAQSENTYTELNNSPSHKRRKLCTANTRESSFIDPFDLTINVTEESITDLDSEEEYEPSFNVNLRPSNMLGLTEVTLEEQEFGVEETEGDEAEDERDIQEEVGSGIIQIKDEENVQLLTQDETRPVYKKCLLRVASINIEDSL